MSSLAINTEGVPWNLKSPKGEVFFPSLFIVMVTKGLSSVDNLDYGDVSVTINMPSQSFRLDIKISNPVPRSFIKNGYKFSLDIPRFGDVSILPGKRPFPGAELYGLEKDIPHVLPDSTYNPLNLPFYNTTTPSGAAAVTTDIESIFIGVDIQVFPIYKYINGDDILFSTEDLSNQDNSLDSEDGTLNPEEDISSPFSTPDPSQNSDIEIVGFWYGLKDGPYTIYKVEKL